MTMRLKKSTLMIVAEAGAMVLFATGILVGAHNSIDRDGDDNSSESFTTVEHFDGRPSEIMIAYDNPSFIEAWNDSDYIYRLEIPSVSVTLSDTASRTEVTVVDRNGLGVTSLVDSEGKLSVYVGGKCPLDDNIYIAGLKIAVVIPRVDGAVEIDSRTFVENFSVTGLRKPVFEVPVCSKISFTDCVTDSLILTRYGHRRSTRLHFTDSRTGTLSARGFNQNLHLEGDPKSEIGIVDCDMTDGFRLFSDRFWNELTVVTHAPDDGEAISPLKIRMLNLSEAVPTDSNLVANH